ATQVSGTITVNGASAGKNGRGNLRLRNASGDDVLLGATDFAGSYFASVIPGTYDLYYALESSGSAVPMNSSAKLQSGIVVGSSPMTLNSDVPTATLSGTFTMNGMTVPVPTSTGVGGTFWLATTGGDAAYLTMRTGPFTALVVPGTYDLYYGYSERSLPLPTN